MRLLLLTSLSVLIACKDPVESSNDVHSPRPLKVSNTYVPNFFETDDRKEQIASIETDLHELLVNHARERNIPGIAYGVVVDNELVLDSAIGLINMEDKIETSTSSVFRIASMTKSFTAMSIVKLYEEWK